MPVLVFLRAIIVRREVSKPHLVFHRELVALAFDPRSIDEDTCVCLESREGDADVIVDLVYLTDGACILELGRGLLLDSCRRRSTVQDRSVACFVAILRLGSICSASLQSSVVLRRSLFCVAIEARTEHDAVFSSHANCRGSFSDCFERIFHLKPRFVRPHARPCRRGQLFPFHVRFDVDPTRFSRARTGVRPARRR